MSVTFEGTLTVTDAEKFVEALKSGIGREKAYGHGMMTIMP
jgi:CRISPR system Cascade subunit CasE